MERMREYRVLSVFRYLKQREKRLGQGRWFAGALLDPEATMALDWRLRERVVFCYSCVSCKPDVIL